MSQCTRFEQEGLLALERGEPLDAHFSTCLDCRRAREFYAQLERHVVDTAADYRAPRDFEAGVWARIAREDSPRVPWYRRWWPALALPALAVTALWLLWPGGSAEPARVSLSYSIVPAGATMRGDTAQPGDALEIRATTAARKHALLRVYRSRTHLLVQCSTEPPCQWRDGVLSARVDLPTRGDYRVVLVLSDAPLPPPIPDLARDLAKIEDAGGRVERSEAIRVR